MNEEIEKRNCYCLDRGNPKMDKFFADIPEGYCGICDVCGEYGHLNAHPTMPTSGSWCDEHYDELLISRTPDLSQMFGALIIIFSAVMLILYGIYL